MRLAKTLQDLVELFSDYTVNLQLSDGAEIYLTFPKIPNQRRCRGLAVDTHLAEKFGTDYEPQSLAFRHKCSEAINALVSSPEFWRKTTVADVFGGWAMRQKEYGKIKCRKKFNQPFTAIFENREIAKKFFDDLNRLMK